MRNSWRSVLAAFALAGAVATAGAQGGDEPANPRINQAGSGQQAGLNRGGSAAPQAHEALQVKTFRLKHVDPGEVQQALSQLCGGASPARPAAPGAPTASPASPLPRIAVDVRTQTLFVRGTEKQLQTVGDVINLLDAEPGTAAPEFKNLRVFHLRHARVDEGLQVLSQLDLNGHVVALRKSNTLIVFRSSPQADDIKDIIEALDGDAKASTQSKAELKPRPGQPKVETRPRPGQPRPNPTDPGD